MIFSDTNNHWNLVFIFHASGLTITFMLAHHLYFKVDSLNALWFFFGLYKYQKPVYLLLKILILHHAIGIYVGSTTTIAGKEEMKY